MDILMGILMDTLMDILMDKFRLWEVFNMSNQFEMAKRGVAFVANISDGSKIKWYNWTRDQY